jgi:hypothetical protein
VTLVQARECVEPSHESLEDWRGVRLAASPSSGLLTTDGGNRFLAYSGISDKAS